MRSKVPRSWLSSIESAESDKTIEDSVLRSDEAMAMCEIFKVEERLNMSLGVSECTSRVIKASPEN